MGCRLTIFGRGIERRSVQLDGGRLNQPDGLRIEDAFPSLNLEGAGLIGLEFQLTCPQGRVDITKSRIVMEMISPDFSVAYSAGQLKPERLESELDTAIEPHVGETPMVGVGLRDANSTSSLVIINSEGDAVRPELKHSGVEGESPLQIGTAAAHSVTEFPLDEVLARQGHLRETLWGPIKVDRMWGGVPANSDSIAYYMLYRDPTSKQPLSVCAL